MSMCVLGMHEEFRKDNIAVNAIWPRTAIWTAALDMLTSGKGKQMSRKVFRKGFKIIQIIFTL